MNITLRTIDKNNLLQVKHWLLLLVLITCSNTFANIPSERSFIYGETLIQDSLVLKKSNSKREFILKKERKIKVYVGGQEERGTFLTLKNDTLSMDQMGTVLKYNINDISLIKVLGGDARNVLGIGLKIWGSLIGVAGLATIFAWGAPGLLIAVPAWAVGYGIFKVGDFATGNRKFNLRKKWGIS